MLCVAPNEPVELNLAVLGHIMPPNRQTPQKSRPVCHIAPLHDTWGAGVKAKDETTYT